MQQIWAAAATGLRVKKKNPSSCNLATKKTENKEHSAYMQRDSQEGEDPGVGQVGRIAIDECKEQNINCHPVTVLPAPELMKV